MAVDFVTPTRSNGNDRVAGFPLSRSLSRKVFTRVVLRRLGALEDDLERLEQRLSTLEAQPAVFDPGLTPRVDNLVEIVGRVVGPVERLDKRSARSRRRLASIADRVEAELL